MELLMLLKAFGGRVLPELAKRAHSAPLDPLTE